MSTEPALLVHDPGIRALRSALQGARDPQIVRIVASVDAMMRRGPADLLIEPLRRRLARLRPPRPLRFGRLLFHPLDLLVVPTARWRPGQPVIPRTALTPLAEHVRMTMGAAGAAIEKELAGRTTDDGELISELGRSLWPGAGAILADTAAPRTWTTTRLGHRNYRRLAGVVASLLAEAAIVDTLRAEAATGLLQPDPEVINGILRRMSRADDAALPMMIALMLDGVSDAAALLPSRPTRHEASAMQASIAEASDLLLWHLDREEGAETRVAAGTLADASAAVKRIAALLQQLDAVNVDPKRRDRLRAVRQRLDADCKARFVSGLQDELLSPLQHVGVPPEPARIPAIESAARGLRRLAVEGRAVGSGATYRLLLDKAATVIKSAAMRDRLAAVDQLRLVEILIGSDAALALLEQQR